MAGFGAYMLAGAAAEVGDGLIERARQLREERLMNVERQWKLDDEARADAKRASRGGSGGSSRGNSNDRAWKSAYDDALKHAQENARRLGIEDTPEAQAAWAEQNVHIFDPRLKPDTPEVAEPEILPERTPDASYDAPEQPERPGFIRRGFEGLALAGKGLFGGEPRNAAPEDTPAAPPGFGPATGMTPDPTRETSATPSVASEAPRAPAAPSASESGVGGALDIPPAPANASERIVGQKYRAPDGRVAIWRGNGWELVE